MKNLKISIIIAVICIIIAILATSLSGGEKPQAHPRVFGKLPRTVNRIEITTPQTTFDLVLKDGYWIIPQKHDYYSSSLATLYLLNSFKKAKLDQKVNVESNTPDTTTIKVFVKDKLITTVDVFDKNNNKYAKVDGSVYLVSGLFDLPQDMVSWMEQPVLDISEDYIQSVECNGQKTKRDDYYQAFTGDISWIDNQALFKVINYVYFEDVLPTADFNTDGFESNQIKITTFDGLISNIKVYSNGSEYWVQKEISAAPITRKGVNEYIKSREFLYNGWTFKIPSYYGKGLMAYAATDEGDN